MKIPENSNSKRREFLKSVTRIGLLAGFVALGLKLGLREHSEKDGSTSCFLETPCGGCNKYNGCIDPRAISFKSQPQIDKKNINGGNGERYGGRKI
jgi:hypothetical protein